MKSVGILAAFVLVIGITVAVTWALLTKTSDPKINVFTGTEGLKIQLDETKWDGLVGSDYGEKNPDDPDDTEKWTELDPGLGQNMAKNYSPNQEIPKDPKLTNITTIKTGYENDAKEYVALRLTYQIKRTDKVKVEEDGEEKTVDKSYWETISYKTFQQLADVYVTSSTTAGFNLTDWDVKAGTGMAENTIFYYKNALNGTKETGASTGNVTSTLFDYVKIKDTLASDTLLKCEETDHYTEKTEGDKTIITVSKHEGLAGFRIVVEGFAVQAYENGQDITLKSTNPSGGDNAQTALDKLIGQHPATIYDEAEVTE